MKTLKISLLVSIMLFASAYIKAQTVIDELFDKYSDKDGVTSVYITQKMFALFADIDNEEDEDEFTDLVKNLKYIKILSIENDTLGRFKDVNFHKDVMKNKDAENLEELMIIKKDGKDIDFLVQKDGKSIKELIMVMDGDDEKVLISIVGDIDLKTISKLSKTMRLEGMENLEKLGDD